MSSDETFVLLGSAGVALVAWIQWYWQCGLAARFGARRRARAALWCTPAVCLGILGVILWQAAAEDVRYDVIYLIFYLLLGMAWLGLAKLFLGLLGLSARDDVIERGNKAAAWAISGGLLGLTLCFAGGNIGDGPGWWVVVFSAFLATAAFFLVWWVVARLTGWADQITIDRDPGAGMRSAGFFVGTGLILGRAVAGDWHSAWLTFLDFLKAGWPVLFLAGAAIFLERQFRPGIGPVRGGNLICGWLPAIGYAALGVTMVALMGSWR